MSFGIPVRNGLGVGLLASTFLSLRRAAYPAMSLDFLQPFLDSRITFSRGSNATLVDATGKIVYAPANLVTQSQDFTLWGTTAASTTANVGVAPNGTTTADLFTANGASSSHTIAFSATGGISRIFSVYLKANTNNFAQLYFSGDGAPFANFNLAAGTVGTVGSNQTATIENAGNGWYRCNIFTNSITAGNLIIGIISSATVARAEVNTLTTSVLVWGAQLEPVTYQTTPSTYVATTASAYYGPRFDYDPVTLAPKGLLIEEARTNLLIQSEAFDNVAWGKAGSTVSANVGVAPTGSTTADKIVEDTSTGVHEVSGTVLSITLGQSYATTFFLKADGRSLVRVMQTWNGTTDRVHADFDLSNGTVGAAVITGTAVSAGAPVITSFGNGWYRCQISGSCATGLTLLSYARMMSAAGVVSYTGNGTSGVQIWGGQAEAGSFATSYIPTVASTVTRSADVATMTGTNFSSWYNQSEGTIVANCSYTALDTLVGICGADAGNGDNAQVLRGEPTNLRTLTRSAGVSTSSFVLSPGMNPAGSKAAYAYALNNCSAYANGLAATGTSGALPAVNLTQFTIGAEAFGTFLNGHIRQIAYYNKRLPNAQLQTLTT